ncbi:MAG: response regulator, partial [Oscillospiraceae bacterium]
MPVKSGIEALREILAFDKKAKVIIASSAGTQTHLKTAIESGAIDFIQKPINNEYVYKIITQ